MRHKPKKINMLLTNIFGGRNLRIVHPVAKTMYIPMFILTIIQRPEMIPSRKKTIVFGEKVMPSTNRLIKAYINACG